MHNLVSTGKNGLFYYSIVRIEDQSYAERKVERYNNSVANNTAKSNERFNAAQEGADFLRLGEPIKVGHHSEKRHRALIERNNARIEKSFEYADKAEAAKSKAEYWEAKAQEITLAMPESIYYFTYKLEKAIAYQKGLKYGTIKREHSYSLTYASKEVKELKKKVEIATLLWK